MNREIDFEIAAIQHVIERMPNHDWEVRLLALWGKEEQRSDTQFAPTRLNVAKMLFREALRRNSFRIRLPLW